jgi:hypothetical protein
MITDANMFKTLDLICQPVTNGTYTCFHENFRNSYQMLLNVRVAITVWGMCTEFR